MANLNTSGEVPPSYPAGAQQGVTPVVIMGETCPTCKTGLVQSQFTACGICLAICCFPLGLLCCFLMRERRCSSCGASFGRS